MSREGIPYKLGRLWSGLPRLIRWLLVLGFVFALYQCIQAPGHDPASSQAVSAASPPGPIASAPATPAVGAAAPATEADVASLISIVNDTKDTPQGRLAMLKLLTEAAPEEGAKFDKLKSQLEAQVARIDGPSNGTPLSVPSDSKAKYTVLEKGIIGAERFITTRRVGPSGTSYSTRAYNCGNRTVRYLGSGDSWQAMKRSKPEIEMTAILDGSIADYVGRAACS